MELLFEQMLPAGSICSSSHRHGQDPEDAGGAVAAARRVALDRAVSAVDPGARHGHETSAHGFDGYEGHVAIGPDAEIVTGAVVTSSGAARAVPVAIRPEAERELARLTRRRHGGLRGRPRPTAGSQRSADAASRRGCELRPGRELPREWR